MPWSNGSMRPVASCSATLKSKGLEENTVVLFVSDNGWPGKDKVYPSELGMRTPDYHQVAGQGSTEDGCIEHGE